MPAPLDPICLFTTLHRHGVEYVLIGGLAAALHGSPAVTNDADIVPKKTDENLGRLSTALVDLEARLRSPIDAGGIPFDPHPELIASMAMLNTSTRCGNLDLTFTPTGLDDYERLAAGAVAYDLDGVVVLVASLADVIRSKEAANRPRDRAVLPILYALQEELEGHQ